MNLGTHENKVVIFTVGRQEYAVPITVVKEVVPWTKPTQVPEAPPIVEGVIDLRGDIVPIIDLGKRFGTSRSRAAEESKIIVMEVNGRQAGVVVDEVTEVYGVQPASVTPPSPWLKNSLKDEIVCGILKVQEGRLVVMVEVSNILAERILGVRA